MNLQEAKSLRSRMVREVMAANEIRRGRQTNSYVSTDVDEHFSAEEGIYYHLVTAEGDAFGVLAFHGSYSDYGHHYHWSEEEWVEESMGWWQDAFNPEGEWSKRTVMRLGEIGQKDETVGARGAYLSASNRLIYLNCGHADTYYGWGCIPQIGDVVPCIECRDAGAGWSDDLLPSEGSSGGVRR